MPSITFPNQRMVKIHRESAKADFLGIKNENWQAAARDLGAHGLRLYLYFAANANNYTLALSPAAVRAAVGIPRSTYFDQFAILVDKGYLVPATGNTYDFYEVPQAATQTQNSMADSGQELEENPSRDSAVGCGGHTVLPEDIEINNNPLITNPGINNTNETEKTVKITAPKVKEITIKRPVAEGRNRPVPIDQSKKAVFEF